MKNKGAKQKLKRKGVASVFGCDLTEYLEGSGQDGNCLFSILALLGGTICSPHLFFFFLAGKTKAKATLCPSSRGREHINLVSCGSAALALFTMNECPGDHFDVYMILAG